MATTADALGIARGNLHEYPINKETAPLQDIVTENTNMPPTRRHGPNDEVDEFTQRESMHVLMLSSTSMCKAVETFATAMAVQAAHPKEDGGNKRVSLLMAVFGLITLVGAGANFLTTSSFAVGGKNQEVQQVQKDLQRLQADYDKMEARSERSELKLREYEVWLQTTREKLADRGWKLPPLPKQE